MQWDESAALHGLKTKTLRGTRTITHYHYAIRMMRPLFVIVFYLVCLAATMTSFIYYLNHSGHTER